MCSRALGQAQAVQEAWRKQFGRFAQIPDGAVGVAVYPTPPPNGGNDPPLWVFVGGNLGGSGAPGNLVFLNKYNPETGALISSLKWGGVENPLRRAVAVAAIGLENGPSSVYVLVQEPAKLGTTDVVLLVVNPDTMESYSVPWSYQPSQLFHGNDIPIGMAAVGYVYNTLHYADIAVAVQSENATHNGWDIQTLLFEGSSGANVIQMFDNSRISYGPGNDSIPVGVSVLPREAGDPGSLDGTVFVAGTTRVGTEISKYVAMGYTIAADQHDPTIAAGRPAPQWPAPQLYDGSHEAHPLTATAMVGIANNNSVTIHDQLYITGYATHVGATDSANWVTVKWDNGVLDTGWISPPAGAPPGTLNVGEYDNDEFHRNDFPRAIEVRSVPGTIQNPGGHFVWVAGSAEVANGTYDVALVQYQDETNVAPVESWRARLFTNSQPNQGNFDRDDLPIAMTSVEVPHTSEPSIPRAEIFITGQSWTAATTTISARWDYLLIKYNSAMPEGGDRKRENWAILGSDTSRGGTLTNGVPAGLVVWKYGYAAGRDYHKVLTTGQALDFTSANGGLDAMTVWYTEP